MPDAFALRFSRGTHDYESPDKPPHLISVQMVGKRGGVLAEMQVDSRLARRWYESLGRLLGEAPQ